ncbi:uncharacterized protein MONOS_409 [Monocercomonoides exilis]|uniref:uncharacterized protein n=1 Tax=Monocercomonoides exilis TaxID=2049356 RepID=UPI00355A1CB8|nr:hypothetical protein MONOS_409 [Monocercomonoides exilis]|eukprot:MONOS_409.1-p1 / transcript=MONOS_409.1 / gene=MONOS_409 / organism=Monocercomonoides_exilis_PA203 / gene_product=unspecified product / transcript_product=unspecified product / location=Mono_scaffold00006:287043-287826(+) / protein_length=83 / sequence_SO=supercontig / SO=protein_coding / is_pseudo=false
MRKNSKLQELAEEEIKRTSEGERNIHSMDAARKFQKSTSTPNVQKASLEAIKPKDIDIDGRKFPLRGVGRMHIDFTRIHFPL